VIIEPIKAPEKIGAIFVPELAKDKPTRGIVVAIGPGRWSEQGVRIPMTVAVGDEVVFNFYSASQIDFNGVELRMVHEHEINCIIKK
jgi:chaperonin GroES